MIIRPGHRAAVIVGEHDYQPVFKGRIEHPLAADVKIIDVHQRKNLLARNWGRPCIISPFRTLLRKSDIACIPPFDRSDINERSNSARAPMM
ncbi:hypothetical protein [Nitrosospira sp. NRS527]|uniref:hypothetical protein n=1 Tax=Nitrosospira sp. NRS527 TaxID=155925 RepID=UPI001AF80A73|nr:hypothetical protein [Nitrosospira sp. NRS527]BCT67817.1 hypothetical protein NNRS527_01405 [Nitrosospira sp. NRS527]